jgi:hypothetical protein
MRLLMKSCTSLHSSGLSALSKTFFRHARIPLSRLTGLGHWARPAPKGDLQLQMPLIMNLLYTASHF